MNDRYLYRAKRMDNGEWVGGNLIWNKDFCDNSKAIIIPTTRNNLFTRGGENGHLVLKDWCRVDPSTICQCTGLMEKNGNPIFENDIVKYHFGEKYARIKYGVYQSCFDSTKTGHCGFYVDWPDSENKRKDLGYWINMVDAEIAGNVFDNRELLE